MSSIITNDNVAHHVIPKIYTDEGWKYANAYIYTENGWKLSGHDKVEDPASGGIFDPSVAQYQGWPAFNTARDSNSSASNTQCTFKVKEKVRNFQTGQIELKQITFNARTSSSNGSSYTIYKAFNNSVNGGANGWASSDSATGPWIRMSIGNHTATGKNGETLNFVGLRNVDVKLINRSENLHAMKTGTIYGNLGNDIATSSSDASWVQIGEFVNRPNTASSTNLVTASNGAGATLHPCNNATPYKMFELRIKEWYGSTYADIGEIIFFGEAVYE